MSQPTQATAKNLKFHRIHDSHYLESEPQTEQHTKIRERKETHARYLQKITQIIHKTSDRSKHR